MNLIDLAAQQNQLAPQIQIPPDGQGYQPQNADLIFALDVQYVTNKAFVAVDVQTWGGKLLQTYVGVTAVEVDYQPQYFCFREGPPLVRVLQSVNQHLGQSPQLILVDGHGLAHPRRFGVACWVGLHTQTPTVGCAKRTLLSFQGQAPTQRGQYLPINDEHGLVGTVLVTQNNVKPVYVSPGHLISQATAREVILHLSPRYRLANPLRRADEAARAWAKNQPSPHSHFLDEL